MTAPTIDRYDTRDASAIPCRDHRCCEGIAECLDCNGYGVLTAGGKRYTRRGKGRNIGATAQPCPHCHGTAMVAHGCRELGPLELAVLAGTARFPDEPGHVSEAWAAAAPTS